MSVKLFFKHPITMRNSAEIQNLIAEKGLKGYAQYMLLLEFLAERYVLEGETKVQCNHNQLATLLRCKPYNVPSLLLGLHNQSIIKVQPKYNQSIIECVKLPEYLGFKLKSDIRKEDSILEYSKLEESIPSGALDSLDPLHTKQIDDSWDKGLLNHFSEEFLAKYWFEAKEYYASSNMKKPFNSFILSSLTRSKQKFEDPHFEFYKLAKKFEEM